MDSGLWETGDADGEMDAAVTQLLALLIGGGGASFAIEDGAAHSESHKAAACGGLVWVTVLPHACKSSGFLHWARFKRAWWNKRTCPTGRKFLLQQAERHRYILPGSGVRGAPPGGRRGEIG